MSRRTVWIVIMIAALCLMAIAGCGGKEEAPTSPPAAESVTTTEQTGSTTETPTPAAEIETEEQAGEEASESEAPVVQEVVDRPDINSYRSKMVVESTGAAFEGEEQQSGNMEMLGEYVREPAAQRMIIRSGTGEDSEMEYIVLGGQAWMKLGGKWMQTSSDQAPSFADGLSNANIGEFTSNLGKMKKIGKEDVNGFKTTHYSFDQAIASQFLSTDDPNAPTDSQGDFWVTDDGLMIKWQMTMSGKNVNSNLPDAEGTVKMSFEISDINTTIEIVPPEMPSVADTLKVDLPMPEGATLDTAMEGIAIYKVAEGTIADLSTFYADALTAAGFTAVEGGNISSEESASLTYQKDGMTLMVMISKDSAGTGFQIMLTTQTAQ